MAMVRAKGRVGEINVNNSGRTMAIIAYRSCTDIDVQFDDKTVVEHKQYSAFLKGSIRHPQDKWYDRNGEMNINCQGLNMYIAQYKCAKDIAVGFEDGTIVWNQTYGNFKRGLIRNPNHK